MKYSILNRINFALMLLIAQVLPYSAQANQARCKISLTSRVAQSLINLQIEATLFAINRSLPTDYPADIKTMWFRLQRAYIDSNFSMDELYDVPMPELAGELRLLHVALQDLVKSTRTNRSDIHSRAQRLGAAIDGILRNNITYGITLQTFQSASLLYGALANSTNSLRNFDEAVVRRPRLIRYANAYFPNLNTPQFHGNLSYERFLSVMDLNVGLMGFTQVSLTADRILYPSDKFWEHDNAHAMNVANSIFHAKNGILIPHLISFSRNSRKSLQMQASLPLEHAEMYLIRLNQLLHCMQLVSARKAEILKIQDPLIAKAARFLLWFNWHELGRSAQKSDLTNTFLIMNNENFGPFQKVVQTFGLSEYFGFAPTDGISSDADLQVMNQAFIRAAEFWSRH